MNFDQFHNYVAAKGYKIYEVNDEDYSKSRSYSYGQRRKNIYASRVIIKYYNSKTKRQTLSFQTLTSGDYLNIKGQLNQLNFKLADTRKSNKGTVFLIYEKASNSISLATNQEYNARGEKITYYQIKVSSYQKL
jgi:hypothetical protein